MRDFAISVSIVLLDSNHYSKCQTSQIGNAIFGFGFCTVRPMQIKKVQSTFTRLGMEGDFGWMIEQPQYARSLFVFNDNEAQFKDFHANEPNGLRAGGGNAIIRPYQAGVQPRAAGIPTGNGSGYKQLNAHVLNVIDMAIDHIKNLLASGDYDELIYSYDPKENTLGSGIYDIDISVRDYIFNALGKM